MAACGNYRSHAFGGAAGAPRLGISLMEVLISIFVVAVGLLGVAALIPLAHFEANRGVIQDRKSLLGKSAYREFRIRGMLPQTMVLRDREMNPITDAQGPIIIVSNWSDGTGSRAAAQGVRLVPGMAYAIDPRFLAVNAAGGTEAQTFPYNYSGRPSMRRVTLRARSFLTPRERLGQELPPMMTPAQAEEVFVFQDDLVFQAPEDLDLMPAQQFSQDAESGLPAKRQSLGEYSWMATLAPVADHAAQYMLAVVVFHLRDSGMAMNDLNDLNERSVQVSFVGGGYAGGDVMLRARSAQALEVVTGSWMLVGASRVTSGKGVDVFKWYRIIAADEAAIEDTARAGQWTRNVTLEGADWDTARSPRAAGTLVDGVVAVYEKNVQLESSTVFSAAAGG